MALSFRHQAILDVARNIGRLAVDDLAERLTVTPQTIRRDLNDLCDQGHLTRVHGGAILESGVANHALTFNMDQLMGADHPDHDACTRMR